MDILYLLVPLSVLAMFGVLGVFAWALWHGQFDGLEDEGRRVLFERAVEPRLDPDQAAPAAPTEESAA
jgi:cbb3-type cytochrome oxidase maturation protein